MYIETLGGIVQRVFDADGREVPADEVVVLDYDILDGDANEVAEVADFAHRLRELSHLQALSGEVRDGLVGELFRVYQLLDRLGYEAVPS